MNGQGRENLRGLAAMAGAAAAGQPWASELLDLAADVALAHSKHRSVEKCLKKLNRAIGRFDGLDEEGDALRDLILAAIAYRVALWDEPIDVLPSEVALP